VNVSSRVLAQPRAEGPHAAARDQERHRGRVGQGRCRQVDDAANLALALQAEGASVGVLDADIYGPSQPRMLGSRASPTRPTASASTPKTPRHPGDVDRLHDRGRHADDLARADGHAGAAAAARETNWSDLDYLIIDLPPGTGDIQLTLCQRVPVSGAIIVTTPQDIALLDARKGSRCSRRSTCRARHRREHGDAHLLELRPRGAHLRRGGGEQMAAQYGVPLLGSLPLDIRIREQADGGTPTVAADARFGDRPAYREIAAQSGRPLVAAASNKSIKFRTSSSRTPEREGPGR
jgi:ATP-binding protein involved in chromosome partitioning